jgi:hypothetical protein
MTITWPRVGDRVRMIGNPPNGPLLGTVIQVRRVLVRVRWDEMRRSRKWDTSDVAPHFLLPLKGEK